MAVHRTLASITVIPLLLISVTGCGAPDANRGAPDANRVTFKKVNQAESQPTFREARHLLSTIDVATVTDPDLRDAIGYQRRLCDFCIEVGVKRETGMDYMALLKALDYEALLAAVVANGITSAPETAKGLVNEAAALRAGLVQYRDTMTALRARYP